MTSQPPQYPQRPGYGPLPGYGLLSGYGPPYGMPDGPMPGAPYGPPVPQGSRSPAVTLAVRLMVMRAVLGVVGLVVTFATLDSLRAQVAAEVGYHSAEYDRLVSIGVTVGVVSGVVGLVLYLLLAWQVSKGRN